MTRIATTTEASSYSDLTSEWKIIARMAGDGWLWMGGFPDLFGAVHGPQPSVSTVTGRDERGVLVLYARLMPDVRRLRWR